MSIPLDGSKQITQLKRFYYPKRMIFFDTESYIELLKDEQQNDIEHHSLRLGVAIYLEVEYQSNKINTLKREIFYFKSTNGFWKFADSKTEKNNVLYIYAHNAKYDTMNVNIIDELIKLNYDLPFPTISNAFIVTAKKGKKKIKVVDTFNYAKTSVKSMGDKLGIPKINLDDYYDKKKKEIDFNLIPDDVLLPYCENDVVIIEQYILKLIEFLYLNKLGSLKFTTASIAMDIYRHRFITEPIYYHKNDTILKLERQAYRGGIVECFYLKRLPKNDYYLLDINSMYVNVMAYRDLPTYAVSIHNEPLLSDLIYAVTTHYIVADVLLCVGENNGEYALKHNDKLIFPIGEFRITLHQAELEKALADNLIEKVFSYVVYHAEPCLSEYALYFSDLKKKATNKLDYDFSKLLGNGLYGKFGMRKYLTDTFNFDLFWKDDEQQPFNDKSKEKISTQRKENLKGIEYQQHYQVTNQGIYLKWNNTYIRTFTDELKHVPRTNIALAGSVTAYSRILLSSYIKMAGREHVYYSDTDSLAVDQIGYERLKQYIDDKELGKLKCEFMFNGGNIRAPKNYTFCKKKKLFIRRSAITKGVETKKELQNKNKNKKKELSVILQIKQKSIIIKRRDRSKGIPSGAQYEDGKYHYWRFTTFKEGLRSGFKVKGRKKVFRKNSLEYNKGKEYINKNNVRQINRGRTQPFVMEYVFNEEQKEWKNQIKQ